MKKPSRWKGKLRLRHVQALGSKYPVTAQAILNALLGTGVSRSTLSFAVEGLPPSANDLYSHSRFNTRLNPKVLEFRDKVEACIGHQKHLFKTGGMVCAVILLENPLWVTKELTIRQMDVDNRPKALFDAIKLAINVPDETNWEFHCYKILSKNTRTTVLLVDLGDIAEFYG